MNNIAAASFFGLIRDYLVVYLLKIRQSSPATILSYRSTLNQLLDYMNHSQNIEIAILSFEDFNSHIISGFIGWLLEHRKASCSTCNQRLGAIKAFFSYCTMRDLSHLSIRPNISDKTLTNGTKGS